MRDYDDEKMEEDKADAVETQHELKRMSATAGASKRRHKRDRDIKRVAKQIKRKESGEAAHSSVSQALTFPAIQLVYDPQKFSERLFAQLQQSGEVFRFAFSWSGLFSSLQCLLGTVAGYSPSTRAC